MLVVYQTPGYVNYFWRLVVSFGSKSIYEVYSKVVNVLLCCYSLSLNNEMLVSSWPWSYGSWIYNYLCNQRISPLMLWVWTSIWARCTPLCDKVCQWLATGHWFPPGPLVSSTNITDCHDITELLLKVALNTIYTPSCLLD